MGRCPNGGEKTPPIAFKTKMENPSFLDQSGEIKYDPYIYLNNLLNKTSSGFAVTMRKISFLFHKSLCN
jgi:hypothetical protein